MQVILERNVQFPSISTSQTKLNMKAACHWFLPKSTVHHRVLAVFLHPNSSVGMFPPWNLWPPNQTGSSRWRKSAQWDPWLSRHRFFGRIMEFTTDSPPLFRGFYISSMLLWNCGHGWLYPKETVKDKCKLNSIRTLYQLQDDPFLWCTLKPAWQSPLDVFHEGRGFSNGIFSAKEMEQVGYFGCLQKCVQELGSQSAP